MRAALDREALPAGSATATSLDLLLSEIATGDLYDLQERYVLLFDRTRSLSLHLFEHVHGESRDRGQAMVDLKALYESHGLDHERQRAAGSSCRCSWSSCRRSRAAEAASCSARPAHILAAIGRAAAQAQVGLRGGVLARSVRSRRPSRKREDVAALLAEPDRGSQRPRRARRRLGGGAGHLRPAPPRSSMLQGRARSPRCALAAGPLRDAVPEPSARRHRHCRRPRLRRAPCATPSITSCSAGIPISA